MRTHDNIINRLDWPVVILYLTMVLLGWMNIFASEYDAEVSQSIFDLSLNAGKQLIWIGTTLVLIAAILTLDFKLFDSLSYTLYGIIVLLLILVLIFGQEVAGSKSWFDLWGIRFQPSEFTKFATALAISRYLSNTNKPFSHLNHQIILWAMILVPAGLIVLQGDSGTAMVFSAFILVFYREGLSPTIILIGLMAILFFILTLLINQIYLIIGVVVLAFILVGISQKNIKRISAILIGAALIIGFIKSIDFVLNDVLKPHQKDRITVLINPAADPLGVGWNITQSKIAIGSGEFWGKGFLQGTQTKFDFVPEQSTDFIFCTIGEEHGWVGSFILVTLFVSLLIRLVQIAERQKSSFARIYGYGVVSIIFFHFAVNIAMTVGLFPVIGIPLPFFSYGGSALWAFSILLFILLKLDAHRMQIFIRR